MCIKQPDTKLKHSNKKTAESHTLSRKESPRTPRNCARFSCIDYTRIPSIHTQKKHAYTNKQQVDDCRFSPIPMNIIMCAHTFRIRFSCVVCVISTERRVIIAPQSAHGADRSHGHKKGLSHIVNNVFRAQARNTNNKSSAWPCRWLASPNNSPPPSREPWSRHGRATSLTCDRFLLIYRLRQLRRQQRRTSKLWNYVWWPNGVVYLFVSIAKASASVQECQCSDVTLLMSIGDGTLDEILGCV